MPRRGNHEMTSEYLGRVLKDYLNFPEMAKRARNGHFDDYFCPPEVDDGMNIHRLCHELNDKQKPLNLGAERRKRIIEVIEAAKTGAFDGTKAEAERWAASKAGQDVFKELLGE